MDFLHDVDEYGVANYKTRYLAIMGMIVVYIIIAVCAFLLQHFESANPQANVTTYGEAFWVLIMASSTIGLMLYKNSVGSKNGRTEMVEHLSSKASSSSSKFRLHLQISTAKKTNLCGC